MLTVANVTKAYSNGSVALRDISLNVDTSEIIAIVGASGCGKSTLLRLIAGLDRADHGHIRVDGTRITRPDPAIGIVFQEPRLFGWLTVAGNAAFGLQALPEVDRRSRVEATLAKVGLRDFSDRWPKQLSGGQAQRVALARSIVASPRLLLMDEPFSALDAFTRAALQDLLLALWDDHRPTLVLVTHDIDEAIFLADRIVVMRPHPGQIAAEVRVESPRPRNRLAPDFEAMRHRIMQLVGETLKVAADIQ